MRVGAREARGPRNRREGQEALEAGGPNEQKADGRGTRGGGSEKEEGARCRVTTP